MNVDYNTETQEITVELNTPAIEFDTPTGGRGLKGETGSTGPQGPQGETGPQGPQGIQGIQGEQGPKGDTGDTGPKGDKGDKGDKGNTGEDGYTPVKGVDYFTEEDIESLNIPTKTSDLNNDSGFITSSSLPTKVSDLTNDTGFITNTVNNLTNYYTSSNTYTKTEVNNLISTVGSLNIEVVQTLPTQDISTSTIYLVPNSSHGTNNYYDEYIYVSNAWELIGSTQVDLSNYYTKAETDGLLDDKADTSDIPTKVSDLQNDAGFITTETDPIFTASAAHGITSTDISNWNNKSTFSGNYNDLTNKPTIPDELADLSSDSTHRLVTDTEKTTWNNKSDFSGDYDDLTDKPIYDASYVLEAVGSTITNEQYQELKEATINQNIFNIGGRPAYSSYHGTIYISFVVERQISRLTVSDIDNNHTVSITENTLAYDDDVQDLESAIEDLYENKEDVILIKNSEYSIPDEGDYDYWFARQPLPASEKLKLSNLYAEFAGMTGHSSVFSGEVINKDVYLYNESNLNPKRTFVAKLTSAQLNYNDPITNTNFDVMFEFAGIGDIRGEGKYRVYGQGAALGSDGSWTESCVNNNFLTTDVITSLTNQFNAKQDTLVSGTNIKTINNQSLLGDGNIDVSGGGSTPTDVRINGTSITSNDVADIQTQGTYNSSTNKIATMSDIPTVPTVGNAKTYYGTSTTGATTAAKTVTCSGFTLETGATIFVKFTNANTYNGTATLNVNSTGAKDIARVGTTKTTRYYWSAGELVGFTYDGTNWLMIERGTATTTYYGLTKLSSSTSSTSTELAATPSAVKAAYDLANGKQNAITSTNKLDYSLIDNTPTIPTKVSDLSNDTGFITNTVNNLTNYYTTSNTYTKSEVDSLINSISTLNIQVVQSLPSTGSTTTIYLVPKTASTNDAYDEYIYVNNSWEHIGSTEVDLSNYYNKSQVDTLLNGKANTSAIPTKVSDLQNDSGYISSYTETDPTVPSHVKSITQANITSWNNKSDFSGSYNDLSDKPSIPDSTSDLTNDSGFITNAVSNLTNYTTTTALQTLLDGKMDYTELTGNSIRIWSLEEGFYINSSYATVYYYGSSDTTNKFTIDVGSIIMISDATNRSSNHKTFLVVTSMGSSCYMGYSTSSAGELYDLLKSSDIKNNLTTSATGSVLDASQGKALKDLIDAIVVPTKVSDLSNDTGFITSSYHDSTKQDTITATNKLDYSLLSNTPTIPTVPTNVSAFTNDAGYITNSALSGYATTSALQDTQDQVDANSASIITNTNSIGTLANLDTTVKTDLVSAINEVKEIANIPYIDLGDIINITRTEDEAYKEIQANILTGFYIYDNTDLTGAAFVYPAFAIEESAHKIKFAYIYRTYATGNNDYDTVEIELINTSGKNVTVNINTVSKAIKDIKINNNSLISNNHEVNLLTNTAYDSTTNKLATMADVPATVSPNIMTTYLASDFTIANTNTIYDLTNTAVSSSVGSKLTFSNGKIVIGAGVSKVKVSYTCKTISAANTTRTFTYLMQDINGVATAMSQEGHWYGGTNWQVVNTYGPITLNVNQGDAFYLRCYGYKGNTIAGAASSFIPTILTVEVIE